MSDITKDLNRVLALSKVKHEARNTLKDHELEAYELILSKFDRLRESEHEKFHAEFRSRIDNTHQTLTDQAKTKNRKFWHHWVGGPSVDHIAIGNEALGSVLRKSGKARATLDRQQTWEIGQYLDRCEYRRERREFGSCHKHSNGQQRRTTRSRRQER